MKTPLQIACRACASQPGEQCRTPRLDLIECMPDFHEERVIDAASFDEPASSNDQLFEAEVVAKVAGETV